MPDRILDPLDWIHAITSQIGDPGQHLVRSYAWSSNRTRGRRLAQRAGKARAKPPEPAQASVRSLLTHPELWGDPLPRDRLLRMGVRQVFECNRRTEGRFRNFGCSTAPRIGLLMKGRAV